jgi:nucleoid-associated protein YgaU
MKHHSPPTIPVRTGVAVTLSASAAIAILATLPLASPPADPTRVVDWWSQAGTAQGAVALVRIAGIAAATYVAVVGGLVTLSALARLPRLARTMARGLPTGIQRSLAGATIAASTLSPSFAAATHADPPPTPIVLFDIGPADPGPAIMPDDPTDTTPVVDRVPSAADSPNATEDAPHTTNTWTVQRGDHLWSIAKATLTDRSTDGETPSERQVARYWQRLIAGNRGAIGADPDLIHPGITLVLPPA